MSGFRNLARLWGIARLWHTHTSFLADFTADLRFRNDSSWMRKVWRDNDHIHPLESHNKLITLVLPLPSYFQADSHTCVRNGGAAGYLMPPLCSRLPDETSLQQATWCHLISSRLPDATSGYLMPPRSLYLDLSMHVMRDVCRFCLRAHTLAVESSI